ncbi:hypothetical protein MMC25_003656 [Agyrium rufum]|nr:hypothetical protein [Agyrium rufum]
MDAIVQRLLTDKLYDKRKQGALELERVIREASSNGDHDKIGKIVDQLCHDFAYAVHQPHARNGGLIGLAGISIALGYEEVARYLKQIVPPVLACFTDQDARVRYYACESMYNIAKVAKGEILLFFNDVFDALCKLAADSELSVKNGAELLDRLVKDIVSESASTYVSVLDVPEESTPTESDSVHRDLEKSSQDLPMAFSLPKFIPLLQDRIYVINPFTRTFLVSWVTLLDTIPDLELVFYLPAFLGGLFKFLSDPNRDVHVATQGTLERFLNEIKKIAKIKRGIAEGRKGLGDGKAKTSTSSDSASAKSGQSTPNDKSDQADEDSEVIDDTSGGGGDGDWIPGQDVRVDHPKILEILVAFLDPSSDENIQLTSLRWIDSLFEICPEDMMAFVPQLVSRVLPAMANGSDKVRAAANGVNNALMDYIMSLPDEPGNPAETRPAPLSRIPTSTLKESDLKSKASGLSSARPSIPNDQETEVKKEEDLGTVQPLPSPAPASPKPAAELDYSATVSKLTLHFLNEHEATRVAALSWLIMLHKKAPRKVLATNDGTFPALLKTLSDSSDAVVTRDLQLLSQISKNGEDDYFNSFMVNLLQLFCTDRPLLETKGNLIIRQLCTSLSAERIYRTLADCLEKDEDVEFASIMVQNLNNNLITAPELAEVRKRLRNLETKDGATFFVALFRAWCHNAVATFSLCLLAQAYEQAYNLLLIFADLEMTVNMLIQIDKLVQLLESPVFTYLRLQLLEPEKYPHLYKCLYGVLMLLPQSSAFAALKNRLNSVSAIGYLHIAPRPSPQGPNPSFDRPNRLKAREDGVIRWGELLEKFRSVQDKARRATRPLGQVLNDDSGLSSRPNGSMLDVGAREKALPDVPRPGTRPLSAQSVGRSSAAGQTGIGGAPPAHKSKSSLGNFSRLAAGVGGKKLKK